MQLYYSIANQNILCDYFHCFIIFSSSPVIKKMLIKDNPEETTKKRRSYDALDLKMETSKVTNVFHSVVVLLKRHVYIRAYKMVYHTFPILTLCFDILTPNCLSFNVRCSLNTTWNISMKRLFEMCIISDIHCLSGFVSLYQFKIICITVLVSFAGLCIKIW